MNWKNTNYLEKSDREAALLLAEEHLITRWQLENALQAQLIYHGSILANLMKLGYLNEKQVLAFLSRQYKIPIIKEDLLKSIPERILDLLPKDQIDEWLILPVGIKNGYLVLATPSPLDQEKLQNISAFVGMKIKPVLTSEKILVRYVLHYYAISLPSVILESKKRHVFSMPAVDEVGGHPTLYPADLHEGEAGEGLEEIEEIADAAIAASVPADLLGNEDDIEDILATLPSDLREDAGSRKPPPLPAGQAATVAGTEIVTESDAGSLEIMDVPFVEPEEPAEEGVTVSPFSEGLENLEDMLDEADNRDDIIQYACKWLSEFFEIALFLTVKKSGATGFHYSGKEEIEQDIKELELSLNLASICSDAKETNEPYIGLPDEDTSLDHMARFFGKEPPVSAVVLPISLKAKPIGLLVGLLAVEESTLATSQNDCYRAQNAVGSSFETLILSKKVGV